VSLEEFGYREELRRALSTQDLVIYGLIFMVPIAPYAVFGFVWSEARGMVALAYLLGLTGMFFTAMSYAAMSQAFPLAGSVYAYAQRGLHEVAGFFAGWLILLDYILLPSLLYLISAVALRPLFPAVAAWVWVASFIAINAIVNFFGIEFTARLNRIMLLIELLALAWFIIAALLALHGGAGAGHLTLRPLYDSDAFSLQVVAGATSVAVLSFLGFDGISTLSEETRGGPNSIGRATVASLLLVGVLFVAQTWLAADLGAGMHFSSPETAFYEISDVAGGRTLRLVTILVSVFATAIANAMAAQAAVSRVLYAMARDGKLPRVFALVHPRYRTPYVSNLFVALIALVVGVAFTSHIDDLVRVVNFGALSGFVLLHLSVIRHFFLRERSGRWVRHLLVPLVGLCIIGYVLFEMEQAAKILGGCWIAFGCLYLWILTRWFGKPATLHV
jgi:amino acid transporter